MLFIILLIIAFCAICKAIRKVSEQRRQAELARIKAERERAKQAEAWRRDMEREQRRLDAEQIRQRKEQEKAARERARQAAQIEKNREEIAKLKQTTQRLSAKLEDQELRIINLESVRELVYNQFLEADHAGDDTRKEKALRKLISIDNQLSAARDAKQKTLDGIENAKRKLTA